MHLRVTYSNKLKKIQNYQTATKNTKKSDFIQIGSPKKDKRAFALFNTVRLKENILWHLPMTNVGTSHKNTSISIGASQRPTYWNGIWENQLSSSTNFKEIKKLKMMTWTDWAGQNFQFFCNKTRATQIGLNYYLRKKIPTTRALESMDDNFHYIILNVHFLVSHAGYWQWFNPENSGLRRPWYKFKPKFDRRDLRHKYLDFGLT